MPTEVLRCTLNWEASSIPGERNVKKKNRMLPCISSHESEAPMEARKGKSCLWLIEARVRAVSHGISNIDGKVMHNIITMFLECYLYLHRCLNYVSTQTELTDKVLLLRIIIKIMQEKQFSRDCFQSSGIFFNELLRWYFCKSFLWDNFRTFHRRLLDKY